MSRALAQYKQLPDLPKNRAENKRRAHNRQLRARKAGKCSGKARRKLAKGRTVPHRRSRGDALALAYNVKQVTRARFDQLDYERRIRLGIGPSERGTQTLWVEYVSCMRAYRAQGQHFATTNTQRALALAHYGRPRCERTVQRAHAQLRAMGLLRRVHVKRGGAEIGNRDFLRIQLQSFVTPPSAAAATAQRAVVAAASRPLAVKNSAVCDGRTHGPAPPSLLAPPGTAGGPSPPAKLAADDQRQDTGAGAAGEPLPELGPPSAEELEIAARLAAGEPASQIMRSLAAGGSPHVSPPSSGPALAPGPSP